MNWGFNARDVIKHLEFTFVVAAAIAAACVMIGQSAERYAASEAQPVIAASDPSGAKAASESHGGPVFNAIDYATTGSIKGQTVVISPCTGQQTPR